MPGRCSRRRTRCRRPTVNARASTDRASPAASASSWTRTSPRSSPSRGSIAARVPASSGRPRPPCRRRSPPRRRGGPCPPGRMPSPSRARTVKPRLPDGLRRPLRRGLLGPARARGHRALRYGSALAAGRRVLPPFLLASAQPRHPPSLQGPIAPIVGPPPRRCPRRSARPLGQTIGQVAGLSPTRARRPRPPGAPRSRPARAARPPGPSRREPREAPPCGRARRAPRSTPRRARR